MIETDEHLKYEIAGMAIGPPIQLGLPPKSLHPNGRAHHMAKAKAVKRYRQQSAEVAGVYRITSLGGDLIELEDAIVGLEYRLTSKNANHRHDPDNLIAWAKAGIDALTDAGILADDRQVVYLPPIQRLGEPVEGLLMYVYRRISV